MGDIDFIIETLEADEMRMNSMNLFWKNKNDDAKNPIEIPKNSSRNAKEVNCIDEIRIFIKSGTEIPWNHRYYNEHAGVNVMSSANNEVLYQRVYVRNYLNGSFNRIYVRIFDPKTNISSTNIRKMLNYLIQTGVEPNDIEEVSEEESLKLADAMLNNKDTGALFEVYKYLGWKGYPGQRDISIVWSFLCRNQEDGLFYISDDEINYSCCNPNVKKLQEDILSSKEHVYFNSNMSPTSETVSDEKSPIAIVPMSIVENLVLEGNFDLNSDKIVSGNSNSFPTLGQIKEQQKEKRNKECEGMDLSDAEIRKLFSLMDAVKAQISREYDLYIPDYSEKCASLQKFVDGKLFESGINELVLDKSEHIIEFRMGDYYKRIRIAPGHGPRKISVL